MATKFLTSIVLLITSHSVVGQSIDYNTKKGMAVQGYDVVSYFNNQVTKGSTAFTSIYDNVEYIFSSQDNLDTFEKNPTQYIPQYGGYCAYAIAVKGKKVNINPKSFEIRNGKLYLFYNAWGNNTLDKWLSETPEALVKQADENWKTLH